jgi:DNA-binding IclR family transcriptional regulator
MVGSDFSSSRNGRKEPIAEKRPVINSVAVSIRLLEALCQSSAPVPLKTLAQMAGMSAPKAHKYLAAFMRGGLVSQARPGEAYDLGPLALSLGLAAMRRLRIVEIAQPALDDLRAGIGHTVALAVWANLGPAVIRRSDIPDAGSSIRLGTVLPLLSSAIGLTFAAYLDRRFTYEMIQRELEEPFGLARQAGFHNLAGVDARLAEVRAAGIAFAEGVIDPGRSALCAPVFDHTNNLVAVIGTFGIQGRQDLTTGGAIAASLLSAATELSRRLGAPLNRHS